MPHAPWTFDEFKQSTVDFSDPAEVRDYDRRQGDSTEENRAMLAKLEVKRGDILVDLGTGTGAFAVEAARAGARVHAVDISQAMLDFTAKRAHLAGVGELVTCTRAGFLSYEHAGRPADFVVTQFAFHHLPDFWKGVALTRIAKTLRTGGKLYLEDIVFSFPPTEHAQRVNGWIDTVTAGGKTFSREIFEGHVRDEFSTYDW